MCLHLSNGATKDPDALVYRIRKSMERLSPVVLNNLCFGTEDRGMWRWQNIKKYFPDMPIILDTLHHACNNEGESVEVALDAVAPTWGNHVPLIHHSTSKNWDNQKDRRSHSDYANPLPSCLVDHGVVFDVELEAKKKDLAWIQFTAEHGLVYGYRL